MITPQTSYYQQRYQQSLPGGGAEEKGPQTQTSFAAGGDPRRRIAWRQRDPDWENHIECFICKKKGHAAYRCPNKVPQVHSLQVTDGGLTVEGVVGEKQATLLLDSGAELTLVPPNLVEPSCHTGQRRTVMGATGPGSFPTVQTTIAVGGKKAKMTVLAKEGLAQPLLGRDFPGFYRLLAEAIQKKEDREKMSNGLAEEAEELLWMQNEGTTEPATTPVPAVQTRQQTAVEQKKEEDEEDATASSETISLDLMQLGDDSLGESQEMQKEGTAEPATTPVLAVQTRQQKALEQKREEDDEDATASFETIPLDLMQLGDDLFSGSQERRRLSRAQKRAQAASKTQPPTRKGTKTIADIDPHELTAAQLEDESLKDAWESAEAEEDGYLVQKGMLYHRSTNVWGEEINQVVLPRKFRAEVLSLAHCSPLAAHLGQKKTCSKILAEFFWPGLTKEVREFCRSCEHCQKGSQANRRRAPLMPLPTIEELFRRLAMDIVGPLRRTKRGHKYILTVMDFATRYPEAIPLRRIDAATVAEALCDVFTRLGIPDEILSDQGSNFMSELLHNVMELLQIHQLKTSPYHPQTDGMLERFHGTLKGMMRKTCRERKEWDEYLPYVCFAFRDSIHPIPTPLWKRCERTDVTAERATHGKHTR